MEPIFGWFYLLVINIPIPRALKWPLKTEVSFGCLRRHQALSAAGRKQRRRGFQWATVEECGRSQCDEQWTGDLCWWGCTTMVRCIHMIMIMIVCACVGGGIHTWWYMHENQCYICVCTCMHIHLYDVIMHLLLWYVRISTHAHCTHSVWAGIEAPTARLAAIEALLWCPEILLWYAGSAEEIPTVNILGNQPRKT